MFNVLAKGHPDAEDALLSVKRKIEADENSCHRCIQPMGGKFPQCQGLIWKYDFAPASVRGATRKSWRLVVYAKNLAARPKELVAMACYSKSDEVQFSLKSLAGHMSAVQMELPNPPNIEV